ncbi:hypothetical protein Tb11.v4.0002 [Trypanosoma brucei brucei TREU927]|uniref:Uncharacterized protein n=1 Tax=Trypanosoma brucei brucei (strain 927/4 GUTat10.1) TaxID=185431 RepID=Q382W8_TRYB2|nr:hypothetical protein Tb11.v4.0002 [Trypanosoma brucei brucei TREU927]EAN80163.1 hypothetical protein Tb11.v4.0002 [Trypanosoma brucei brucei TREU927]
MSPIFLSLLKKNLYLFDLVLFSSLYIYIYINETTFVFLNFFTITAQASESSPKTAGKEHQLVRFLMKNINIACGYQTCRCLHALKKKVSFCIFEKKNKEGKGKIHIYINMNAKRKLIDKERGVTRASFKCFSFSFYQYYFIYLFSVLFFFYLFFYPFHVTLFPLVETNE